MITLAQAKVGMADKVDQQVIDEFRRGSYLLENLIFDNTVSPSVGGGSTLVYGYVRLKTPATASFRPLNTEYTPNQAIRTQETAKLKIFGGEFNLDRVVIETAGPVNETAFQIDEKTKGAINLFHYTAINGDSEQNPDEFDGLDVFLTGSSTEYNTGGTLDISSSSLMDSEYNRVLDMMDEFVSGLAGRPTLFLTNTNLATKIKGIARRAGYYTRMEDAFGRSVDAWNDIPIVDLQEYFNPTEQKSLPVVPIAADGTTSLYAVEIARDGFHGASPLGNKIIKARLPDINAPGVIKKGDVEAVMAVVLKNSRKAGAFRNIKVR